MAAGNTSLSGSLTAGHLSRMKKQLWLRLKQYHFDDLVPPQLSDHVRKIFGGTDPSTQAFASKLARKLGWTRAFSLRAIEEYRKFVSRHGERTQRHASNGD